MTTWVFLIFLSQSILERSPVDLTSLLLGLVYGSMLVMAFYNFILYFSFKDNVYLFYVGVAVFNILTLGTISGIGSSFFWMGDKALDELIYVTFGGISNFFASRFASTFLRLKEEAPILNKLTWVFALLSVALAFLPWIAPQDVVIPVGRVLVFITFPVLISIGWVRYRKGYRPALYYVIAWIPYGLALALAILNAAMLIPQARIFIYVLEIGGAIEIVLFSFALAFRIRQMRLEIINNDQEKEQIKLSMLEERKTFLEQEVNLRTKELKQANATKDKFFSIIAHDLRSPMIALQGVGQKLEYFIKKDKQEKLLEMGGKIDESIDQLNHLLNNLLNWAASETGSIPKNPTKIDLKELVVENIVLYNSLAKTKSVKIVDETTSQLAYADANMVSTIIRNLLSNAIKFTPKGGKVIIRDYQNARQLGLSIKDEGPGMDTEQIAVLGSGELASATGSNNEKGFGLGLKLCREFVELNFGAMDIQSEKGKGSVFSFVLPREVKSILRDINAA